MSEKRAHEALVKHQDKLDAERLIADSTQHQLQEDRARLAEMVDALEAQKEVNAVLVAQNAHMAAQHQATTAEMERIEKENSQHIQAVRQELKSNAVREEVQHALEVARIERDSLRQSLAHAAEERNQLANKCSSLEAQMQTVSSFSPPRSFDPASPVRMSPPRLFDPASPVRMSPARSFNPGSQLNKISRSPLLDSLIALAEEHQNESALQTNIESTPQPEPLSVQELLTSLEPQIKQQLEAANQTVVTNGHQAATAGGSISERKKKSRRHQNVHENAEAQSASARRSVLLSALFHALGGNQSNGVRVQHLQSVGDLYMDQHGEHRLWTRAQSTAFAECIETGSDGTIGEEEFKQYGMDILPQDLDVFQQIVNGYIGCASSLNLTASEQAQDEAIQDAAAAIVDARAFMSRMAEAESDSRASPLRGMQEFVINVVQGPAAEPQNGSGGGRGVPLQAKWPQGREVVVPSEELPQKAIEVIGVDVKGSNTELSVRKQDGVAQSPDELACIATASSQQLMLQVLLSHRQCCSRILMYGGATTHLQQQRFKCLCTHERFGILVRTHLCIG